MGSELKPWRLNCKTNIQRSTSNSQPNGVDPLVGCQALNVERFPPQIRAATAGNDRRADHPRTLGAGVATALASHARPSGR